MRQMRFYYLKRKKIKLHLSIIQFYLFDSKYKTTILLSETQVTVENNVSVLQQKLLNQ